MGHVWIFQPDNNPNTNLKNSTKMGHWAQNQASAMAIPVLWPEPYRKWVRWTEEEKHQHGAVNLKDLERFCMKEWSLISYQVFSKLFRHYRRKLRAVTLGKGLCNNWVPIIVANMKWRKYFLHNEISPHFQLFYFNDRLEFCEFLEWKIKRINNADLFSQPPLLIFTKGANISGGHCKNIHTKSI